jgi:hypothetical protein
MRKATLLLICLIPVAASLSAGGVSDIRTVRGSGTIETREFAFEEFSGVDAGYAFIVTVREGSDYRVSVTTDDNIFESLRLEVMRGTLHAGLQPRASINATRVEIDIVMPALERLEISGAVQAEIGVDRGDQSFEADLSGASVLTGRLRAGSVVFDASGASRVEVAGEADTLSGDASGASRLRLYDFPVRVAQVDASGASTAELTVSESLEADASGASTVRYDGDPAQVRSDTSGGSRVQRR